MFDLKQFNLSRVSAHLLLAAALLVTLIVTLIASNWVTLVAGGLMTSGQDAVMQAQTPAAWLNLIFVTLWSALTAIAVKRLDVWHLSPVVVLAAAWLFRCLLVGVSNVDPLAWIIVPLFGAVVGHIVGRLILDWRHGTRS